MGTGDMTSQSRGGGGNELPPISINGNSSGAHAAIPLPTSYSHFPLPKPHITHVGPPPILDKEAYPLWAFRMRSHMKGASEELWRITDEGFHPHDCRNMTPREYRDNTLNNHALLMIQKGVEG